MHVGRSNICAMPALGNHRGIILSSSSCCLDVVLQLYTDISDASQAVTYMAWLALWFAPYSHRRWWGVGCKES